MVKIMTLDTEGNNVYGAFKYGQGYINDDTYFKFIDEYNKCDPKELIILNICSSGAITPSNTVLSK